MTDNQFDSTKKVGAKKLKEQKIDSNVNQQNLRGIYDPIIDLIDDKGTLKELIMQQEFDNARLCETFDCQIAELNDFRWCRDQDINTKASFLLQNDINNRETIDRFRFRCEDCDFDSDSLCLWTMHCQSHDRLIINKTRLMSINRNKPNGNARVTEKHRDTTGKCLRMPSSNRLSGI